MSPRQWSRISNFWSLHSLLLSNTDPVKKPYRRFKR
nr:MAG TPA: hypothetical protein [Caudoviricetes sp.]